MKAVCRTFFFAIFLMHLGLVANAASLSDRLVSADDRTRLAAQDEVGGLSSEERQKAAAGLASVLKGGDVDARERAFQALTKFGPDAKPAIPALKLALGDDYPVVRQEAVEVLKGIGEAAVPALTSALQSPSSEVRTNAAVALTGMAEKYKEAVTPALIEALKSKDSAVREQAIRGVDHVGASAVPSVVELLKADSASTRLAAVQALGRLPTSDPSVSEQLVALWKAEDAPIRIAAARALVHEGASAVAAITPELEESEVAVRKLAAETLGEIGKRAASAVPALSKALKDSQASVRATAASALGKMGSAAAGAVPDLRDAAKDGDANVSTRASEAITAIAATHVHLPEKHEIPGAMPPVDMSAAPETKTRSSKGAKKSKTASKKTAPPKLVVSEKSKGLPALSAEHISAWTLALTSTASPSAVEAQSDLVRAGSRAVPDLMKALRNSDKVDRVMVLNTLGLIGPEAKSARLAILEFVSDFSEDQRRAAAAALVQVDGLEAQATLEQMLNGMDPTPKAAAAEALGLLGAQGASSVPTLVAQLKSNSSQLQESAAGALTKIGTPEAVKAVADFQKRATAQAANNLTRDLGKDPQKVNGQAVDALVQMGPPAVPALTTALAHRSPVVRRGAAMALKALGGQSAPAISALTGCLDDPEVEVRHAAADALEEIGTTEAKKPLLVYRLKSKIMDPWDALMKQIGFK